ncbi:MAG TPA: hypothetical protein VF258_00100 [Luteolibacter sp.]
MGYSIFLKGESFDHDGWMSDLGECDLGISAMGSQLAELLADEQVDEMWLHPQGGMRGVTVRRSNNGAELSLPAGVAEADFLLTGKLIRAAVARGAVAEDEEGRILTGSDEEMRTLGMEYRQFFWSTLSHTLTKGENTLPVGGLLQVKVDPSERDEERWDELERKQLAKMARYEEAYVASLMQGEFAGVKKILSNYHHLPTLLTTQAEWVVMHGEHGDITDGIPIPAERFREILSDRVECLGDWTYVPKIDFAAEPELVKKLKAAVGGSSVRIPPLPGIANPPEIPTQAQAGVSQGELTGADWMLLAKMAVVCGYMVAGADGKVDKKEFETIGHLLRNHQSCPYPVVSKILGIAYASREHIGKELQEEEMPGMVYFAMLLGVLEKFPEEEAAQIRSGFFMIAKAVAESSGGRFGFGPKISKSEQKVLDFIKSALG